jgi:hypothetical protein
MNGEYWIAEVQYMEDHSIAGWIDHIEPYWRMLNLMVHFEAEREEQNCSRAPAPKVMQASRVIFAGGISGFFDWPFERGFVAA